MKLYILFMDYKFDLIAWWIKAFSKGKYNHSVLCFNKKYYIGASWTKIGLGLVTKYFNKKLYRIKFVEIKGLKREEIMEVFQYAINKVQKRSILQWIITFILILFNYKKKTPRRACASFIFDCLAHVDYKLNIKKSEYLLTPADLEEALKK